MTEIQGLVTTALAITAAVLAVGVCCQGRLRHWILVVLGGVPRKNVPGPFDEIPRAERDWGMLSPIHGLDAPRRWGRAR